MLSEKVRAVLGSDALAHVATIDEDGKPQVTVAWVALDGDDLVIATMNDQRKLRNVRRDPRVTISFETDNLNDWGLTEYLVIYGEARITVGDAAELLQRLAHTYMGPDAVFPGMPNPPPGFVTRIKVKKVSGAGDWS